MSRSAKECKPSTSRGFTSSSVSRMEVDSDSDDENSDQNITMLVTNFVKYVINNSSNKHPIKRNELAKGVGIPQRLFLQVLADGTSILQDVYGIGLTEVSELKSTKSFITYPTIKIDPKMLNSEAATELKTLFIVLSYIFMKSGEIQEVNLNNFLEKLNNYMDEFNKSREKFIKQLYLKRRKVEIEGQNDAHFYYSWGERALIEFNKKDILETVAKLIRKPSISFTVQYQDAYGVDPNDLQDSVMIG